MDREVSQWYAIRLDHGNREYTCIKKLKAHEVEGVGVKCALRLHYSILKTPDDIKFVSPILLLLESPPPQRLARAMIEKDIFRRNEMAW